MSIIPVKTAMEIKWDIVYSSLYGFSTDLERPALNHDEESEIAYNIRCITSEEPKFPFEFIETPLVEILTNETDSEFDIIIAGDVGIEPVTGEKPEKGYQHWEEVAKLLRKEGIKVASIGTEGNSVPYTEDMTHLNLLDSISVMRSSYFFLGNDSGLYHVANLMKLPNLMALCGRTEVSKWKNYDPRFYINCAMLEKPEPEEIVVQTMYWLGNLNLIKNLL